MTSYYYLPTGYYRELQEIPNVGETKTLAKSNNDPYLLFCLETRLKPFLHPTERVIIKGFPSKERVDFKIEIHNGSTLVELDRSRFFQLQAVIKYITSTDPTHCILYIPSYIKCIPTTYQHKMENMIQIPKELNLYIQNHIFYVDFSKIYYNSVESTRDPSANFETLKERHKKLHDSVRDQFTKMYKTGYILCHHDFATDWKLVKIDPEYKTTTSLHDSETQIENIPDNLYYSNWTLPMIDDLYPFLTERVFNLPFTVNISKYHNKDNIESFIENFKANFPEGKVEKSIVSVVLNDHHESSILSSLISHFLVII